MKRLAGLALLILLVGPAALAQSSVSEPAATEPQGQPDSGGELRDRDFGVTTREFGLDRRVEMYQWSATDDGYRRVWNPALIDSSGFAPGHENPPGLSLHSERWWTQRATLDGKPLDLAVLRALGRWHGFRPGFSRLPPNLAATFQPEGDGLGSAENPLDPQIGDLRITWRELILPPLLDEVELRDGTWRLVPERAREARGDAAALPVDDLTREDPSRPMWPWLFAVLLPVLVLMAVRRRRGKNKR